MIVFRRGVFRDTPAGNLDMEVHMKKNRWVLRMLALLALSGILMTTALAAEAGSAGDPLVTLSYLNDTFLDTIMQRVDQKIAERTGQTAVMPSVPSAPAAGGSTAASFTVVTLSSGQVLTGDIGCEVLLRIGTASCVSTGEPGLVDETTAGTLSNGGALAENHLYMMTIEGRGVQATAPTTKLMVRGEYTVS